VATFFQTAPGYKRFQAFCAEAGIEGHHDANSPFVCYETQTNEVPTDDKENDSTEAGTTGDASPSAFNLDGPTTLRQVVVEGEEDRQPSKVAAEFVRYHQKSLPPEV